MARSPDSQVVREVQPAPTASDPSVLRARVKIDSESQYALALCRLAYNQGTLRGDLNDLQQLALLAVKGWEDREVLDAEWRQFKYMAIAAHPENTKSIIAALEEAQEQAVMEAAAEEGWAEWGEELSDDDIANWEPYSKQSQEIINQLRRDGFLIAD